MAILNKYKDTIHHPLPKVSSQKLNSYIKECCECVGIDDPTTITHYSGNKSITKTLPKYQLITAHTARKTFVTNSILLGMNTQAIKKITGHKKETTFKKYFDITDAFLKKEMDKWDTQSLTLFRITARYQELPLLPSRTCTDLNSLKLFKIKQIVYFW